MINVTKPSLPPLEEFIPYLESIWKSGIVTNNGYYHRQLEHALCDFLGVKHISLFCNGTIALITALQSLRITGEVITTPYSFVATAHSLIWNRNTPVFVDIDPATLNLDPSKIEDAITPQTTAILPVHCYGRPCDMEAIQKVADLYNLRIIYDAAHSFGVRSKTDDRTHYGDVSCLSFHATKVFNTFEGGAIISHDLKTKQRIDYLKNFGFADEVTVIAPGINGKMNEISASFGLLQLKYVTAAIEQRKRIDSIYREGLAGVKGIRCLDISSDITYNYSYFPIFIEAEFPLSRDAFYQLLIDHGIRGRRYFYPLISEFPMYRHLASASKSNLPVAHEAAQKVLCLPIFADLQEEVALKICHITQDIHKYMS